MASHFSQPEDRKFAPIFLHVIIRGFLLSNSIKRRLLGRSVFRSALTSPGLSSKTSSWTMSNLASFLKILVEGFYLETFKISPNFVSALDLNDWTAYCLNVSGNGQKNN